MAGYYYRHCKRWQIIFILCFTLPTHAMEQGSLLTIHDLPPELIALSLTTLFFNFPNQPNSLRPRIEAILNFGLSCKQFHEIALDTLVWQTLFALIDKQTNSESLYEIALSSLKTDSIKKALQNYALITGKKEQIERDPSVHLIFTAQETKNIDIDTLDKITFLLNANLLSPQQKQDLLAWSAELNKTITPDTWMCYRARYLLHTLLCQGIDNHKKFTPSFGMKAICEGTITGLKQLPIQELLTINNFQETPLIKAARRNQYEMANHILMHAALPPDHVNQTDLLGMSALMCASYNCDTKGNIIECLLHHGASLNQQDQHKATALCFAALGSNRTAINLLLHHKADTTLKTSFGCTPLLIAALRGRYAIVESLIMANKDLINEPDNIGNTPLHSAAKWDNKKVVVLLLKNGADLTKKNLDGDTPLMLALHNHAINVLPLLVSAQTLEEPDTFGVTPLIRAAIVGSLEATQFLLQHGANIHAKTPESERTALHHAAQGGHKALVKLLLKAGATIDAQSFTNFTPLMLAADSGFTTVVELLIKKGAQIDLKNRVDDSALSLALANGHTQVAKILEKARALQSAS